MSVSIMLLHIQNISATSKIWESESQNTLTFGHPDGSGTKNLQKNSEAVLKSEH